VARGAAVIDGLSQNDVLAILSRVREAQQRPSLSTSGTLVHVDAPAAAPTETRATRVIRGPDGDITGLVSTPGA